jgi:predicted ATP-grasp superfamily ATP-dependent carboligase
MTITCGEDPNQQWNSGVVKGPHATVLDLMRESDLARKALALIAATHNEPDDVKRALARVELRARAAEFILGILGLPNEQPEIVLHKAP